MADDWFAAIVTVLLPSPPAATKSLEAASSTFTVTARGADGTGFALSVKEAGAPSSTPVPALTVIVGSAPGSSMPKEARLFVCVAPPPRPVEAGAPSPIATVSGGFSASASAVARNVMGAACAEGPVKTTEALPLARLL